MLQECGGGGEGGGDGFDGGHRELGGRGQAGVVLEAEEGTVAVGEGEGGVVEGGAEGGDEGCGGHCCAAWGFEMEGVGGEEGEYVDGFEARIGSD